MNRVLNKLTSKLLSRPTAKPWTRLVAVALMLGLAGLGSFTALTETSADTSSSQSPVDGNYTLVGRVLQVTDGDTFTLLVKGRQQRVRMASIDAPEIGGDPDRPGQAYGQASKRALTGLIADKTLTLDCYERDRYDRNVCDVPLPGGDTANRKQVAAGMAWANMEGRGKFMRDPRLPDLEQQARRAGAGVWQQTRPVSPWAWRYQCWKQGQC